MEEEQIAKASERMKDERKLPADSKLEKAVEQAKASDFKRDSANQAEQQSDRR